MAEHHNTAKQALKEHSGDMFKPSSYKVDIRAYDFVSAFGESNPYDLVLLDRDCTLQKYHGEKVPMKFWYYLKEGPSKADGGRSKLEIISNSSFEEFVKIRDIFSKFGISVNKLVKFEDGKDDLPHLLRFADGKLQVHQYSPGDANGQFGFFDVTSEFASGDYLLDNIVYHYKKPNPLTVKSVVDKNIAEMNIPLEPKVLMLGDRYMTDIMAGNLAGVDTALVKPYKPMSDPLGLIAARYFWDKPVGGLLSRIGKKK